MKKPLRIHTRLLLLLAAVMLLSFAGCASAAAPQSAVQTQPTWPVLDEDGSYTTAEDVCAYLLAYGRLPDNFITKKEAKALGWSSGSLEPYASATARGCCPRRRAGPGPSVTSTPSGKAPAGMSAWSSPTTG